MKTSTFLILMGVSALVYLLFLRPSKKDKQNKDKK